VAARREPGGECSPLLRLGAYYGDGFTVECPTGSGRHLNLTALASGLAERLISTFERNAEGRRPVFGGTDVEIVEGKYG